MSSSQSFSFIATARTAFGCCETGNGARAVGVRRDNVTATAIYFGSDRERTLRWSGRHLEHHAREMATRERSETAETKKLRVSHGVSGARAAGAAPALGQTVIGVSGVAPHVSRAKSPWLSHCERRVYS